MSTPHRPRIPRSRPAFKLLGAAAFAGIHELKNGVLFLRLFKRYPQLVDELVAQTSVRHPKGDKRDPGSWALLYLAFLLAEGVDLQPWYSDVKESSIWAEAGFERPMGYSTVHLRFTELEHPRYVAAFQAAAQKCIALAIEGEPRLCRHLSTDGTLFRTSARLEHCCIDTVRCRALRRQPRFLKRAAGEVIRSAHDAQNSAPESEVPAEPSNRLRRVPDEDAAKAGLDIERYSYWIQGGHLYRSRDKTAGARKYGHSGSKRRFNFGGICQTMTDTTTGLPVALHFFPADRNEHVEYPELYRQAIRNMGDREPVAVVADRGLSFKSMFEFHTRRGVGLIVPDRNPKPGQTYSDLRTDKVDEHGMPRCPSCGGETTWRGAGLGFAISGIGNPHVRFRCRDEHLGAACRGVKRLYCREDWRLVRPIGKLDPLYWELLHVQKNKENLFDILRDRFNVAGDEKASCPRRPGLPMQRLMGAAAMLIDWFRFCILQGHLASHLARPGRLEQRDCRADKALDRLRRIRRTAGLNLPYGDAAEKMRLAAEGPWAPDPPPDERPF